MKEIKFESIEAYKNFLKERLAEINKTREYDIYLHTIYLFHEDYGNVRVENPNDEDLNKKVLMRKRNSILREGLSLNNSSYSGVRYTTLNGTSVFTSDTKNPKIDKIVDYNFSMPKKNERVVILIAVPKQIKYNGKQIDFSSYKGVHARFTPEFKEHEELSKYYNDWYMNFDSRHAKFSLFDCTLQGVVPKEFILGAQYINPSEDKATFVENEKHICNLEGEEYENLKQEYKDKVANLGLNEDGSNLLEVLVSRSKSDCSYYTNMMAEEI